ncbi:patatin-like phospholipase family protein [Clostridium sp. 1001271st1 H5]|uniref:patatin-like phospholipase family protein n=1 Tax=unclassified Clostridium TaxID=2614128 RepID=UPI0011060214|nr:patatin-like phospholipase family protein [Clostridium sp. 1001271st1 H5]
MGYGLALAGGGTRGAAHVGVLKALDEAGLRPEAVAGASAGGIVAGLFASGMPVARMEQAVLHLEKHGGDYLDPDFGGLLGFVPQLLAGKGVSLSGLIKGDKLLDYFFSLTGQKQMDQAVLKVVIPAVDLVSGNTICFTDSDQVREAEHVTWEWDGYLCEAMMAGASVPAIFAPRKMGRYLLVDGGVTDNLPVNLLQAAGIRDVLAVDIGGDYEAPSDRSVMEVASHSFSIMSSRLKECASTGEVLLLRPPLSSGAGLLTFEQMGGCMERGYEHTRKMLPQIRKALNQM